MLLRALKDKGLCKNQFCCTIMTGTVCVQSEAVSQDQLLLTIRTRSGQWGAQLWGELLEAKGEYLDKTVRSLRS